MQSIKIIALQHINVNKLSHINGKWLAKSSSIDASISMYYCVIYIPYMEAYVHANSLQSFSTLCDPMDCSLPGSSVHRIFQARILEWVAILFSRPSLSTSQRPHLPIPSHWGIYFNIWIWRKHKHSVHHSQGYWKQNNLNEVANYTGKIVDGAWNLN